jgi:hypothetical protein
MRYVILLSLLLAGCNSLDGINSGLTIVEVADKLGVDADTNGVYYKSTRLRQKVCEYKTGPYSTAFRPCK